MTEIFAVIIGGLSVLSAITSLISLVMLRRSAKDIELKLKSKFDEFSRTPDVEDPHNPSSLNDHADADEGDT